MPTLVFEIEDGSRVLAPLDGHTTIGSAEGNDVIAEREDIAAHHAEIFLGLDDAWWVRDLESPAGTFLNSTRIATQRLRPGDLLLFGSISARFSMDAGPVAEEPPSPPAIDPDIEKKKLEIAKLDEALTRARAEFEQTVKEQEARLAKLRDEAAQLEPAMGSKRQQLSGLDAALAKAMADLEKTTRDEQERVAALRSEAAGLEAAVGSKKEDLTLLGSALAQAQEEMEKAAKIHESRVIELKKHASGLESEIGRKQQEITGLSGALQEAGKMADENRRKNEELTKSVTEAAARHEVLSHQVRTLSEQQRIKLVEMERLEQDLASLESRRSATAGVLEQHEVGRQRAEESLKQAALQREQVTAELEKLTEEKNSLTEDVRRLGEQRGSLTEELAELEARKSEMRGTIDGLNQRHTEAQTKLIAAAEELTKTTARHDQIIADIKDNESRLIKLQAEAEEVAARILQERNEAESLTSTRENLIALNQQLQDEVSVVGKRLAEMSRTEERLLESRTELHRTEAAHLSLTNTHDELMRKHAAAEQAALHLESRIGELQKTHDQLEQAIPALQSTHEQAEKTARTLTDEIERLHASAAGEQSRLGDLLKKIDQAQRRQAELEAATKHLGEVQAQLHSAELEKNQLEARLQTLAQDCASSQMRHAEFVEAEKSAGLRVSQLTKQEIELNNAVKQLSDEQQRERQRFAELRLLAQDAEIETLRQKEQLTAQLAELHADIATLETRLMHARSWNAELDHLYEKLGRMPDASPEARETWLEIQRRKNDIADQLPSGIQVRPQSRPTVVPRVR